MRGLDPALTESCQRRCNLSGAVPRCSANENAELYSKSTTSADTLGARVRPSGFGLQHQLPKLTAPCLGPHCQYGAPRSANDAVCLGVWDITCEGFSSFRAHHDEIRLYFCRDLQNLLDGLANCDFEI